MSVAISDQLTKLLLKRRLRRQASGAGKLLNSIGDILPHAARRYGDRTALVYEDKTFSFKELDRLSGVFASSLMKMGLRVGERVILYAPNRWEWLVSYYAVLKVGAVVCPVNVMLTPLEVLFIARDCGARSLIVSPDKVGPLLEDGITDLPIIVFGNVIREGALSFEEMLIGSEVLPPAEVGGDDLSTIGYTSGTTGRPKGAMHSHRSVMMNVAMTAQMHLKTADDVVVSALPCPHVYGNVVFNGAMLFGLKLVLHARFDAAEVLRSIAHHRATMFEGVPTMYIYMLAHPDLRLFDLSSLSRCTVGGQSMPRAKMEEVEQALGCPLIELWGMTELAGLGTTFPSNGPRKLGSIGIALPHVEAKISDVENSSRTLPRGEIGELMIRGPIVMQGYFQNDIATVEAIEPDGWLHSGDLAIMDEEGAIFIVDRKKDMINTAGYKVFPAELERVISSHESVSMVAVGAQPDETKGEVAKAYVVLKAGALADPEAIIAHCRAELAAYKVPRSVQFVDDLPKTSSGKIMRRELRRLDDCA